MRVVAATAAGLLVLLVLWDAFETVVLPRRASRPLRLAVSFYRLTWPAYRTVARRFPRRRREDVLSYFGPLSLLALLTLWAATLVVAFAVAQWALRSPLRGAAAPGLTEHLYLSGTTFFTLGFGDITPAGGLGRLISVVEAGTGFAFLALVIGYLPSLYQAFSRREVFIALVDARAGSPPAAAELLSRCPPDDGELDRWLLDAERWCSEVLESGLSYPVLGYFRSQHDRESWVAVLALVLDVTALVLCLPVPELHRRAALTFAMARHAAVDLPQVLGFPVAAHASTRPHLDVTRCELGLDDGAAAELDRLRALYEPYLEALSRNLVMPLPAWRRERSEPDDWEISEVG